MPELPPWWLDARSRNKPKFEFSEVNNRKEKRFRGKIKGDPRTTIKNPNQRGCLDLLSSLSSMTHSMTLWKTIFSLSSRQMLLEEVSPPPQPSLCPTAEPRRSLLQWHTRARTVHKEKGAATGRQLKGSTDCSHQLAQSESPGHRSVAISYIAKLEL